MAYDITLNDGTVLHFEKQPSADQVSSTVKAMIDSGDLDPEKVVEKPEMQYPAPPLSKRQLATLPDGAVRTEGTPGYYKSPGPIPGREGFRRASMTTPTGTTGEESNPLQRELGGAFGSVDQDRIEVAARAMQRAEAKETLPTASPLRRDLREMNPFVDQVEDPEAMYGPSGMLKKSHGEFQRATPDAVPGVLGEMGGWYASLLRDPVAVLGTDPVEAAVEIVGAAPVFKAIKPLFKSAAKLKARRAAKGLPDVSSPPPIRPSPVAEEVEAIVTTNSPPATVQPSDVVGSENFDQIMTANVADIDKVTKGVIPNADPLPVPVTKSFRDALDQANAEGITERVDFLIEEVNRMPRPLSDAEGAAVMMRGRGLQDQHAAAQARLAKFVDDGMFEEAATQASRIGEIEEGFYDTMTALRRSASERGRALNAQKMIIGKDYDLLSMKARAIAAHGKKLSAADTQSVERLAKNISDFTEVEQSIIQKIADRMGKPFGELDIDVNGFPLDALDSELAKLIELRSLATDLKRAADLANARVGDYGGYVKNLLLDMASTPKMIKASVDFSAPGRQGAVLLSGEGSIANTKAVFKDMFGAAWGGKGSKATSGVRAGEQYAYKAQREIINGDVSGLTGDALKLERLKAQAAVGAGVDYTSVGSHIDPQGMKPGGRLRGSEDQFAGNVFGERALRHLYKGTDTGMAAKGMKGLNKFSEFSERTYSLPLNRLRKEKFLQFTGLDEAKTAADAKKILEGYGAENLNEIADFINMTTGRSKLPVGIDRAPTISRFLNAILFSPKFLWARMRTLARPLRAGGRLAANKSGLSEIASVEAEMKILKELATVATKWGAAIAMLNMALPEDEGVALDPSSANFGKIKLGDTRYDATGGLASIFRMLYKPATAVASGKVREYGGGLGREVEKAMAGKTSPVASLALQTIYDRDFKGDKPDLSPLGVAKELAVPISLEDAGEFFTKYGVAEGAVRLAPTLFGLGASDYKER